MYSYKDLAELAGYTARVAELLETMDDIRAGKFEKALVSAASSEENAKREELSFAPPAFANLSQCSMVVARS